jgi:hypothetical protein
MCLHEEQQLIAEIREVFGREKIAIRSEGTLQLGCHKRIFVLERGFRVHGGNLQAWGGMRREPQGLYL